ncbi:hypothetical protein VTI28DRAFT_10413 [Corynascus sepedonium]
MGTGSTVLSLGTGDWFDKAAGAMICMSTTPGTPTIRTQRMRKDYRLHLQLAASEQVSRILAIESVVRRSADSVEKFEAKGWRELSSLDCHCPADCRPSLERRARPRIHWFATANHHTAPGLQDRNAAPAVQDKPIMADGTHHP